MKKIILTVHLTPFKMDQFYYFFLCIQYHAFIRFDCYAEELNCGHAKKKTFSIEKKKKIKTLICFKFFFPCWSRKKMSRNISSFRSMTVPINIFTDLSQCFACVTENDRE